MKRSIASAALLLVVLAGCAPTPPPGATPVDPRPTPTGSSTPIPVPTATLPPEEVDPLDTVTTVLLQTEAVSFCDDVACGIDGFDFSTDDHETAAAKLSAVFGVEPRVERVEAEEGGVAIYYSWDGVVLSYVVGEGLIGTSLGISVDSARVGDVAIETLHGVHVGMPLAEAEPLAAFVFTGYGDHELRFDIVPDPVYPWDFFVGAYGAEGGSGAVLNLTAPVAASGE